MRKAAPPTPPTTSPPTLEPAYTVAEIAARHKTGREQVHRWIRNGDLEAIRVGKFVRVAPEALADFERRHLTAAGGRR